MLFFKRFGWAGLVLKDCNVEQKAHSGDGGTLVCVRGGVGAGANSDEGMDTLVLWV